MVACWETDPSKRIKLEKVIEDLASFSEQFNSYDNAKKIQEELPPHFEQNSTGYEAGNQIGEESNSEHETNRSRYESLMLEENINPLTYEKSPHLNNSGTVSYEAMMEEEPKEISQSTQNETIDLKQKSNKKKKKRDPMKKKDQILLIKNCQSKMKRKQTNQRRKRRRKRRIEKSQQNKWMHLELLII